MTIKEAIEKTDRLKPNVFEMYEKIKWLSDLDGKTKKNIIDTHEDGSLSFIDYTENTDMDTVLLIPEPYCDIYIKFLSAQIDFNLADFDRYNNSMTMYNYAYDEFARWYNRSKKAVNIKISNVM